MRRPGLLAVAAREVGWARGDPTVLLLLIGVPLLAFAVLAATFSSAVIRGLPIDVVDADNSPTSARFVQAIDAAPGVLIDRRSSDLAEAMRSIRAGDTILAVLLPENLERDVLAERQPQIVVLYNRQFFTPGNLAASAVQGAVAAAAAELARTTGHGYAPGSLVVERYVLANPAFNYAQFLLRAVLPTVLHVVVAVAGAVAVGSEFGRSRGFSAWMAAAGGRPLTALLGKFLPYFGLFAVMMSIALVLLHGVLGVPFRGDPVITGAAATLFLASYLAVGALAVLLARSLATGLALVGVVCSPAFGFAGVGFPILAIEGFGRAWGALLPLRWYLQVLVDQAARGIPARLSLPPFLALAALAVGVTILCWLRLRAVAKAPPERPVAPALRPARGVAGACVAELRRVLGDSGAFGLIVLGPLLYAVLYPQPYLGQLARDVPIAVVDEDGSELSRRLLQALDAHEAIAVVERPADIAAARAAIDAQRVYAVLTIPAGTEREVLRGRGARLPAHVDAAYFLLYNRTAQGFAEAAGTVTNDLASAGARLDGSLAHAALARIAPVAILNQPLFNPTGGYASYIVPAAFVLILQQTLLLGTATLGGIAYEQGGSRALKRRGAPAAVLGQGLAHLVLVLPAYLLYLVLLPRIYGFSYSLRLLDLLVFAMPFILSVSFFGQLLSMGFRHRETAILLSIAVSLPLFFLVGIAWPLEAIPPVLRRLALAIPSTSGISGLVRLDQMGAGFADVAPAWKRLWLLAGAYAALAMLAARLPGREEKP